MSQEKHFESVVTLPIDELLMTRPEWENSATESILRLLADSDLALSAKSIVYNLDQRLERPPSRATVHRALSGALEVGLVVQPEGALYEITDNGRAFLAGELTPEQIEAKVNRS